MLVELTVADEELAERRNDTAVLCSRLAYCDKRRLSGIESRVVGARYRLGREAVMGEQFRGTQFLAGSLTPTSPCRVAHKRSPSARAALTNGRWASSQVRRVNGRADRVTPDSSV